MSYLNQVMLIGNLGENPELLKEEKSGCFVRLTLATHKKYADVKGNTVQDTQWHTVYLNNGVGKYALSYLEKGNKVLVLGELRTKQWKDREGKIQYSTAVYAKECRVIIGKPRENEVTDEDSTDEAVM